MSAPSATSQTGQQHRAAGRREVQQRRRGEVIGAALEYLAGAGPTATGVTVLFPDGTTAYFGVDEARQYAAAAPQGVRQ